MTKFEGTRNAALPGVSIEWLRNEKGRIQAFSNRGGRRTPVLWHPMPGSQHAYMTCPITEVLYEGTRGPGKTDALLMSFAQHIGKWGKEWVGIIFRRTYPELDDVINKSLKWFSVMFPQAKYNRGEHFWEWPTGERLMFRHMKTSDDYHSYHGHSYPFIGFEELTTWPSPDCYVQMLSTCRSTVPDMPRMIRATTNPYGCVAFGDVLTATRGWVPIQEVAKGEKLLSVDREGRMVTASVKATVRKNWTGQMVTRKGRGLFMEFTEDHRLPHMNTARTEHTVKEFSSLPGQAVIRRTGLPAIQKIPPQTTVAPDSPLSAEGQKSPVPELTWKQYAALLGWVISEGCTVPREAAFCISQTKPDNVGAIHKLLQECGFHYRYDGQQFWVYERAWMGEFQKLGLCRDKYIPRRIFECSSEVLETLLETLFLGDGCENGYYTTSRRLADDVGELAVRLGWAVYVSSRQREDREGLSWTVNLSERDTVQLNTGNHVYDVDSENKAVNCKREDFSGEVFCLTVPETETFFIRQNGCVWLSGNSGHNWVKARFRLPLKPGSTVGDVITGERLKMNGKEVRDANGEPIIMPDRVAIRGYLDENFLLLDADPNYKAMISASARNAMQLKAWLEGSWDIVSGGLFDDVWNPEIHLVPDFKVPPTWRMDRSFDWGSSKPFSVGWWAESDGTDLVIPLGSDHFRLPTVPGDLFRVGEWYGWCGEPNKGLYMVDQDIAEGILEREGKQWPGRIIYPGPADSSIFDHVNNHSIADAMYEMGVDWDRADKTSGSRVNGWEAIRSRLRNAVPKDGLPREYPGMYVCSSCDQFMRTFPVLPRSDKNLDDADTEAEDHLADEVRYKILSCANVMEKKKLKGR